MDPKAAPTEPGRRMLDQVAATAGGVLKQLLDGRRPGRG
jgi:hypothetical protein